MSCINQSNHTSDDRFNAPIEFFLPQQVGLQILLELTFETHDVYQPLKHRVTIVLTIAHSFVRLSGIASSDRTHDLSRASLQQLR